MITFDNAPIREVALGRTFLRRDDFLIPHYGAFWSQLKGKFPRVEHAPPIVESTDQLDDGAFLPRVWLIAADSASIVQLQQNRLHYNWRHTPENNPYIRFHCIQRECLEIWGMFEDFILNTTSQPLQPLTEELVYTNFIEAQGANSAFEIAEEVLRDFARESINRVLSNPKSFSLNYTYELLGANGTLQVSATAVKRKDNGAEALKLELAAKGKCSINQSFEQWSSNAHEFIVNAFKDLTRTEMHKKWKIREE